MAGIWAAWFAITWYSTIEKFYGDLGYRGTFVDNVRKFMHLDVDISEKIKLVESSKMALGSGKNFQLA